MKKYLCALLPLLALSACTLQPTQQSAYAGQEVRDIKALAPAEVNGLLAGKGLGYAKSAELNGYPGPAHVLELDVKLALTAVQKTQSQAIFQRMQASAKLHGAKLVQAERELEALFRAGNITPELLSQAVVQVSAIQAKVRQSHLLAHVEQTAILTPHQIAKYIELRGYSGAGSHSEHH